MSDDNNGLLAGGIVVAALLASRKKEPAPAGAPVTVIQNPPQVLALSVIERTVGEPTLTTAEALAPGTPVGAGPILDVNPFIPLLPEGVTHAIIDLESTIAFDETEGPTIVEPVRQRYILARGGLGFDNVGVDLIRVGAVAPSSRVLHTIRWQITWVAWPDVVGVALP